MNLANFTQYQQQIKLHLDPTQLCYLTFHHILARAGMVGMAIFVQSRFSGDWNVMASGEGVPMSASELEGMQNNLIEFVCQVGEAQAQEDGVVTGTCDQLSDRWGKQISWLDGKKVMMATGRSGGWTPCILCLFINDDMDYREGTDKIVQEVADTLAAALEKTSRIHNRLKKDPFSDTNGDDPVPSF